MSDTQTTPPPLLNAVCMHCGYDITGTIPNPDGQVTCPECGLVLKPTTRRAMTKRDVHMHIIKALILPFAIWAAITFVTVAPLAMHDTLVTMFVVLVFMLGYPIGLIVVIIAEWSRLHRKLVLHPRPYPRWSIPLWVLCYSIPTASLYPLVFFVLQGLM